MAIEKNDVVILNYKITEVLSNKVLDEKKKEFILNEKYFSDLPVRLMQEIIGKEPGNEIEIILEPKDAYGERNPKNVKVFSLNALEAKERANVRPGALFLYGPYVGVIKNVSSGRFLVDFNHPFTGLKLKFNIKIEEVHKECNTKILYLLKLAGYNFIKSVNLSNNNLEIVFSNEVKNYDSETLEKIKNNITNIVENGIKELCNENTPYNINFIFEN